MRLVGGSYQWEGRVEVFFAGSWGTITDSDWTSEDAQTVCHMMGYFRPGKFNKSGRVSTSRATQAAMPTKTVLQPATYKVNSCMSVRNVHSYQHCGMFSSLE